MSKQASEFQEKIMSLAYRGKEIFKPLNTGHIDERVSCIREYIANIFFYTKDGTTIMIDAGYNYPRLKEKMKWLDLNPAQIQHILITHQDTDHVGAVETDSDQLFRHAQLYIGEIENKYLTGENRRKVYFGTYQLPMVKTENPRKLLKNREVFYINDIKIESILVAGHTWGHMVYLIDDSYLFTGDTLWLGADGGYSFIHALAEDNNLAKESLFKLKRLLQKRGLTPKIITGHTGWTQDFDFAFAHIDKVCNAFRRQKPHDLYAPYDGYDEAGDTEQKARNISLLGVPRVQQNQRATTHSSLELKAVIGTNSWGSAIYEKALRGSAVDEDTLKSAIQTAVKCNLLMFDTAQDYGFGKGQKMIGELCPESLMISAKYTPVSKKYQYGQVRESLMRDLQDFQRDYVDVYWLHLPNAIEQNLLEMAELYQEGKIRNIGISNFNLEECKTAKQILDSENIPLYGLQNHYSLISRTWEQNGVLDWCRENHVQFWAWAVLEEGLLIPPKKDEKFSAMKFIYRKKREKLYPLYREMKKVGQAHQLTIAQIATCYVANKGIIPVCGCRKPYQILQLAKAVQTKLSVSEMHQLENTADSIHVNIMGADRFRFAVKK